MLRVFDFRCEQGHTNEMFVPSHWHSMQCPTCGALAQRQVASPRFKLEGITGDFPGAHARWEQKRAEKLKIEQRKERDHGDSGWQ